MLRPQAGLRSRILKLIVQFCRMTIFRAIGLMSGTSMDGVDVALLETDGEAQVVFGPDGFTAYSDEDRQLLRAALEEARTIRERGERPGVVAAAEAMVTQRHGEAVEQFLAEHELDATTIDAIGFHGQTVIHRPKRGMTVQIGDGPALAKRLGINVVHDFRAADMAAGGQGAPIVPVYHRALVERLGLPGPVALLNIGGVANVTCITQGVDPVACDTGPGNALLDDLMLSRAGIPMDRHGHTAARGRVDEIALAQLLDNLFFALPAPKSLDRNAFSREAVAHLPIEDAAATLTAFTAASVAGFLKLLPQMPRSLVVCGGGARNPILVRELVSRADCKVTTADVLGWSADAMEAQAFAYLAVRAMRGLPYTWPTTTGVAKPLSGGIVSRP